MSAGVQQSLFFLRLPDLKKLVGVTLTLQAEDEEPRSKQMKTCRELVQLYSDVLASPALDSFTDITVVMAIPFFQQGVLQAFGQRRSLQLGAPQCVFPGDLQSCLSYSLITRLAPSWNKAGPYLVSGKDFLTDGGRLNAVRMELSTSEGRLCLSIDANTVRLPPATLEDFDLPPLVLRRFCSDPDSILNPASIGGAIWCHVLPSMKKGQIIGISRQLPRDGPFRTYRDLQNHWNHLYGYRLPELAEEEVVYCSVYFRPVGDRLFTYPLSCVRLQKVQRYPRVDLQGALGSFLSDVRGRLQSVCGFPARLTSKPCYHAVSLNTAASVQVLSGEQINLTTSISIRPILTQLPAPPPPQPVRSSFGSQSPGWTTLSHQDGAQELVANRGGGGWPSSSSSSVSSKRVCYSYSDSSGYQSDPSLSSSSSSSSLPISQPASFVSSSVYRPPPPPGQTLVNPAPKLVPIFRNKHPSRHVNVALLRLQKEQLSGGWEERGRRLTLPSFGRKTPNTAPPFSSSAAALPIPPARAIPRFNPHPKPCSSGTAPQPSAHPKVQHISSLSPASKVRPVRPKTILKALSESRTSSGRETSAGPPRPLTPSDTSNQGTFDQGTSNQGTFIPDTFNQDTFDQGTSNQGTFIPDTFNQGTFDQGTFIPDTFNQGASNQGTSNQGMSNQDTFNQEASNQGTSNQGMSNQGTFNQDTFNQDTFDQGTFNQGTFDQGTSSSCKKRVVFKLKPKKPRAAVRDVGVEKMARSSQLSTLNSATLLVWLKARGVHVSAKQKKEELMLKVMSCLAEA